MSNYSDDTHTDTDLNKGLTDEQILIYTQHKRKAIVNHLTKGGAVPGDKSEQIMLLQALDGLDRQALGNKRIKADEKSSNALNNASGLIAAMFKEVGSLIKQQPTGFETLELIEPPALTNEIPDPLAVPGEVEINPQQLDYDSFMKKHKVDE